jgi:anaphase-promoting complex subunit 3
MRTVEPYRVKGLETYSTLLWHLQKDATLSFLARDLIDYDRYCPQTWCAVGNCFSLQKDHESALRCFQRAIQLDPFFSYAYTLSGHEHVSNEDFEKAAICFRNSIRVDQRHYNAWYGLGMIYFRQEKYELAEFHFQKALEINANSSVLYCYLGMVMHSTKRYQDSLSMYMKASQIDPYNPLVKFKKAKLLFHLEQYQV